MINFSENIEIFEKVIISYLMNQDDEYQLTDDLGNLVDTHQLINVLRPSFFIIPIHSDVFKYIKEFYKTYHKTPNKDEVLKILDLKNVEYDTDTFNEIVNISLHSYLPAFIYKHLRAFILVKVLNSQIDKISIKLKTTKPNPDNIDDVFSYVRTELTDNIDVDIIDANEGLDIFDASDHIQHTKNTKSTGFEYMDIVLGGGWEPKTFVVFQGRPKVGKSLVLSNLAVRAANLGNNVGIFTVELGESKYAKRVGSNLFSVPFTSYSKFTDEDSLGELKTAILDYKTSNPNAGVLNIKEYPTGSASVLDIENYYIKLQKKMDIKMDVIFVDYVNLLKTTDNDTNMYSKIKKICEDLRRIAMRNNWCIVSATQVKSSSFTSDDLTIDSTAESSALVATVDSLFGITGDPDQPYIKIKNIANRDEGYMNSYANFIKVTEFFRLDEDGEDYMNLGMDSKISFTEYRSTYVDNPDLLKYTENSDFGLANSEIKTFSESNMGELDHPENSQLSVESFKENIESKNSNESINNHVINNNNSSIYKNDILNSNIDINGIVDDIPLD